MRVEDASSVAKYRKALDRFDVVLLAYADSTRAAMELAKLPTGAASPPILVLSQGGDAADLAAQATELGGSRDISIVGGLEELAPRLAYATRRGRGPINDNIMPRTPGADDLQGAKVLIVDDDIRNIFALSSVLEWRSMVILSAETGRDAIDFYTEKKVVITRWPE